MPNPCEGRTLRFEIFESSRPQQHSIAKTPFWAPSDRRSDSTRRDAPECVNNRTRATPERQEWSSGNTRRPKSTKIIPRMEFWASDRHRLREGRIPGFDRSNSYRDARHDIARTPVGAQKRQRNTEAQIRVLTCRTMCTLPYFLQGIREVWLC